MKGSDRNLPCPCGSGRKYKKCYPNHPPTQSELDGMHEEALEIEYRMSPEGVARSKAAVRKVLMLSSIITGP